MRLCLYILSCYLKELALQYCLAMDKEKFSLRQIFFISFEKLKFMDTSETEKNYSGLSLLQIFWSSYQNRFSIVVLAI